MPFFFLPDLFPRFLASIQTPVIPPVYVVGSVYLTLLFVGVILDLVFFSRFLALPPAWGEMAAKIKSRFWVGRDILWIVFILLLIQVCAGFLHLGGVKLGWFAPETKETNMALVQGVLIHGIAFLLVWNFIRRRHSSWNEAFGMNWAGLKKGFGNGVAGYVGIIPIVVVSSMLFQLFLYAAGYEVTLQDVVAIFLEAQSGWSLFLLLALAVVVAPVVEEALFRGVLLPALMKRMGSGAAVALSSLFFAAIHQHLPSLVPLFALAVLLSLIYIYSGSLWSAIILHSVFNGVSICLLLLAAA